MLLIQFLGWAFKKILTSLCRVTEMSVNLLKKVGKIVSDVEYFFFAFLQKMISSRKTFDFS